MPTSWRKHQVVQRYDIGVFICYTINYGLSHLIGFKKFQHPMPPSVIDVDGSYLYRKQQQHLPNATDISMLPVPAPPLMGW